MMKNLTNHFLLPTDKMTDPRFVDALIYICGQSEKGAWGFIVNRPMTHVSVGGLLSELQIDGGLRAMQSCAMNGGFVGQESGFVLHTGLPNYDSSLAVGENISLTTSRDILPLLGSDRISHFLLMMGFCLWESWQLKHEIANGYWLICSADAGILFHVEHKQKLALAYQKLGLAWHHSSLVTGFA